MTALKVPEAVADKWQSVVDFLADLLGVPAALLTTQEDEEVVLVHVNRGQTDFAPGDRFPMDEVYCSHVIRNRRSLAIADARVDPTWARHPEAQQGVIAYVGCPILWPDGAVFGTICTLDEKAHRDATRALRLVELFRDIVEAHLALVFQNRRLDEQAAALRHSLAEIRRLRGILPICAGCKKIRDDEGYWHAVEAYVEEHSEAEFTHGLCPDCAHRLYPPPRHRTPRHAGDGHGG